MRVAIVDTFPPELDAVADASPRATFYHTAAWLSSLAEAYPRMRCALLVAEGDARAFLPYFVARRGPFEALWSLPFGTYGGPVGDEAASRELLAAFRREGERRRVLEVGWVDFRNAFGAGGEVETDRTHVVDISGGFDAVWRDRFDKPRRRRVRRAEEMGVVVRRAASEDDMAASSRSIASAWPGGTSAAVTPRRCFAGWSRAVASACASTSPSTRATWSAVTSTSTIRTMSRRGTAWPRAPATNSRPGRCCTPPRMREACEAGFRSYNLGASLGKASLVEYKQSLGGEPYQYRIVRHRRLAGRVAAALRGWRRSR